MAKQVENTTEKRNHWYKGMPSPNAKGRPSLKSELPFYEGALQSGNPEKVARALNELYAIGTNPKIVPSVRERALVDWLSFMIPRAPQTLNVNAGTTYTLTLPGDNPDDGAIEMPLLSDGDGTEGR